MIVQTKLLLTLLPAAAGIFAISVLGYYLYSSGYEKAENKYLKEQQQIVELWQSKLQDAQTINNQLASKLAESIEELRVKQSITNTRILKYVQNNPTSSDTVFDTDGLQILNDAQQNRTATSK